MRDRDERERHSAGGPAWAVGPGELRVIMNTPVALAAWLRNVPYPCGTPSWCWQLADIAIRSACLTLLRVRESPEWR